jgi:amidase
MSVQSDPFNAFLDLPQVAVRHARSGPLAGLRLAVKDIFDVAGYRTGCGNPQKYEEAETAETTTPAVQAILDAGAKFVGKTQTDELAFSLMGQNAHFPHPVNPAAPGRVTGGSSSGSAAAVAAGLADIAIGSDTGGSIRAPASFCGLVGLRTTHGRIPLDGAMPLAPSMDTFGWFARDIATYEKVAEVVLGATLSSPLAGEVSAQRTEGGGDEVLGSGLSSPADSLPARGRERSRALTRPLRLDALDTLLLGPAEAAEYRRMAGVAASVVGAPATAPALPFSVDDLYWCFRQLQAYEAWATQGGWISAKDRGLGPGVRERFEFGSTLDAGIAAAETRRRDAFRDALAGLLGNDGVIVMPTVPGAAPLNASSHDELQAYRERALRLLCLSGLSGFPQITLPLGSLDGAPFGISLLGPKDSDLALIRLGREIMATAQNTK